MRLRFERGPRDRLETLHPAYFAMVMATGIVAIAARLHGVPVVPEALFWLNALFLAGLAAASAARLLRHPAAVAADLRSHGRAVGYFTTVAACGVFGSQLVLQMDAVAAATVFWIAAAVLWLVVSYGVLTVLTVQPQKPSLADGLHGGWLVIVVATQSLSILTVLMLPSGVSAHLRPPLMFAALALWLGGGALYLWLMALIFLRYTFYRMDPADLTPPYWISMGAVAISTLAGATLIEHAALSPLVGELAPFVKGCTLMFWAMGSWWIPMLVVLGVWRYLIRGVPFAYDPLYWGGVFPLGMYSVCTYHLAQVMGLPFLMPLSKAFMVFALAAWAATAVGLIDSRRRPGGARTVAGLPRRQPGDT
ncbi:MAG: tellurite resistance/C4-dicarboxylate transporter family protein [Rhodospirillaceae bacterium]|nr:tellurite resistance/C4-dicarboxylate transporter family protein [Rhodospirillaceae bacterium]